VWDQLEYDLLLEYDLPTSEQPPHVFGCHDDRDAVTICRGWWDCHSQNPPGHELLSIQFAMAFGKISEFPPPSDVPCFESGQAACDHGMEDFEEPSEEAQQRIGYLMDRHPDLESNRASND
jgi:hypothetical protein